MNIAEKKLQEKTEAILNATEAIYKVIEQLIHGIEEIMKQEGLK